MVNGDAATACTVNCRISQNRTHTVISAALQISFNRCRDQHQHQIKMCHQSSATPSTAFFPHSVYIDTAPGTPVLPGRACSELYSNACITVRSHQVQLWLVLVYNSWLCQIGSSAQKIKGFIFQNNSFHEVNYLAMSRVGDKKKNLKLNHQDKPNTLLTMLYFREILIHESWLWSSVQWLGHCIPGFKTNGLCWCVGLMLQVTTWTMTYICLSLRFLDLWMPPLQVHLAARQSVHSTGTLLVFIKHCSEATHCVLPITYLW